jgi:Cd2+/Zn2+-exporting ATPase
VSRQQTRWIVSGVCCATEEKVLRKSLECLIGPDGYSFNPVTCELDVHEHVADSDVLRQLRRAGFEAKRKTMLVEREGFWRRHRDALGAGCAALLTVTGILLDLWWGAVGVANWILLAAIATGGWKIVLKAYKAIRLGTLDMNVLMTVAVAGALAIGKWDEAAAVIVLFAVALMLESYSLARTRKAVASLMAVSPEQASVLRNAGEQSVPARTVTPGEVIVIRPGERIPLDGVVIVGVSDINEATITGESAPVTKTVGAVVYAGTMNQRGVLTVRVTQRYEETTLARIVHMIESAQESRAPAQDFVDRFAAIYTPAVFGIAILVAILPPLVAGASFADWLYRALILLVIACPCALVISTPVTIVSALTGAARLGILIKGGKYIETLSRIRAIAFDKTGTLTEGHPRVTDVVALDSISRDEALRTIAALEHRSEHHIASALLAEAARAGLRYDNIAIEQFEALPGLGVHGTIGGTTFFLGNSRLGEERHYFTEEVRQVVQEFSNEGKTTVVLGSIGKALCVVAMTDSARQQSRATVNRLRALGIEHLTILSGDQPPSVRRLADDVGLENVVAAMMPAEKVAAVRELGHTYGSIAMVGDGINDSPALAAASVGIAMGVSGTDAALETADVVLMSDDLAKLPVLINLSRKAMRIVGQNITIVLGLKLIFLVLSLTGMATLWMALLADDGAALLVILNGLRALSYTEEM